MRPPRPILALAIAVPLAAGALPRAPCDAARSSRVLAPARDDGAARAAWQDGRTLLWPGAEANGRFRLYYSAAGGLLVHADGRVEHADGALELAPANGAAAPEVDARDRYLGAGARLRVPAADRSRLAALLRDELVLVHETAGATSFTHLQSANALDDLYAAAADAALGPSVERGASQLRLWAPTARAVSVCWYADGRSPARAREPLARDARTGVWSRSEAGDVSGRYYLFLVEVHVPGAGRVLNRVADPYAVSASADSARSLFAQLDAPALAPPGWADAPRPAPPAHATDQVIYELHVRDFSVADDTVPRAHRGKYLAFTDRGSNGMRHLAALAAAGVTDVHLLPVFDFATVPEQGCIEPDIEGGGDDERPQALVRAVADRDCYDWGYDPVLYGAPEGSYASDAADGARRIVEFRALVMGLHALGLRVGMDVVYNHTLAAGQERWSVLDRIVPGYYQRLDRLGAVEHSTCCANTATEHRMMEKLMTDTVIRFARDYRIDSFRFDLMGHQPRAAMERLKRALAAAVGRDVPLIGEGWNFGEVADGARFVQASQAALGGSGIATFSDRARDALRGGTPADRGDALLAQGYLNGLGYDPNDRAGASERPALLAAADLVRAGLAGTLAGYRLETASGATLPLGALDYHGQPAGYAAAPGEVVNYVENHDNHTLFDADALKLPRATSHAERARVQVLGSAFVLLSQGIAYLHAGQETLRSKSLDRNSHDSGDWFNRLDWRYEDNGFARGLPPAPDNAPDWALERPLLADPSIKPAPEDIRFTLAATLDLLRIRASSGLFRLASAAEVERRLRFFNTGPGQVPTVIVGDLDGRGYPGAGFAEIVYLLNVDTRAQSLVIGALAGRAFTLHPVQRAAGAADRRPAEDARYEAATGRFVVPPRTALVWVVPREDAAR